jgi:hypothetical protein
MYYQQSTPQNKYLEEILIKYTVKYTTHSLLEINELQEFLLNWGKRYCIEPKIYRSGSTAKETAISISSDYDFLISLGNHSETKSDIFNSLYTSLSNKYGSYNIRKQRSSIRVTTSSNKIDIVPAKSIGYNDFTIFNSKTGGWTQTNIQQHINDILYSGRLKEIKLMKIWRENHKLDIPSIYLEYLIIRVILKCKPKDSANLCNNFISILNDISLPTNNNHLFIRIDDPSNSNNILSNLLSNTEKQSIIEQAKISVGKRYLRDIIW